MDAKTRQSIKEQSAQLVSNLTGIVENLNKSVAQAYKNISPEQAKTIAKDLEKHGLNLDQVLKNSGNEIHRFKNIIKGL